MTASTRRELRSAATSTSTTAIGLIRALTDARPIKPTSTRCLSARRPNPGRGSTYRRGNSVQTTAATSLPVGLGVVGIAIMLPGGDFVDEDLFVGNAAIEALRR